MKKKTLLLAFLAMLAMTCFGQEVTVNEMSGIKPGARINYSVDFSKSTIMGMTEEDFAGYEKDWKTDKPTVVGKLLKGMNTKLDGVLRMGSYKDSPYLLKVQVKTVTEQGNVICDATMEDSEGKVLFRVTNVNGGKEPPFLPGTKLAKIKVWANLCGRNLGDIIRSVYLGD